MKKKEPVSANTSASRQVLDGVSRPGWSEVVIYLICGLLFTALFNIRVLWRAINNSVQTTSLDTTTVIDEKLDGFSDEVSNLLDGRPGQMLFWAVIGCLIYVLTWLVQNFIINIRNDVVSDKYLHPNSYKSTSYWEGVIAHKIFFGAVILIFALYAYISLTVIQPILSKLFYGAVLNFSFPASIIEFTAIVLLSSLLLYIGVFLAKLIVFSWRTIVNNF